MNCIIPGGNMKILSRSLHALAKIGDELYIEAKPDCLQLATINMTKTVYTSFNLRDTFFSSYDVGEMETNSENVENITCKTHMKSLLGIFKLKGPRDKDKKIELCKIEMENDATKIVFKLKYKQNVTVTHSVHLIDMEFVQVTYPKDESTNHICAPGHFFTQVLSNFQMNDEDMSFEIIKNKVTVRNYDPATTNVTKSIRSQVALNSNEFNTYRIDRETKITLSFKPFRAAIHFAEVFNLNVSLNFETGGKPVVLLMKSPTFEVDFVLSTINPDGATQSSVTATPSLPKTTRKNFNKNTNNQDKNILDNVNWESDFDINDDEEARNNNGAHRKNTYQNGSLFNNVGDSGDIILEDGTNNKNGCHIDLLVNNVSDTEDIVLASPPDSPIAKRIKTVFARCYEPTLHATLLDLGNELAANSDSDLDNNT